VPQLLEPARLRYAVEMILDKSTLRTLRRRAGVAAEFWNPSSPMSSIASARREPLLRRSLKAIESEHNRKVFIGHRENGSFLARRAAARRISKSPASGCCFEASS